MRFIKFRLLSMLALTALVTGTFALPTRAKQPIQTQKIRPLLMELLGFDQTRVTNPSS